MRRIPTILAAAALVAFAPGIQAQATPDTVDAELRSLVSEAAATPDARTSVTAFLERDDVRTVASERGIDMERLREGVDALDDASVENLSDRMDLVGGDTFVITSTTVVIALLVIILIVVS